MLGVPHEGIWLPFERNEERFRQVWSRVRRVGGDFGPYWLHYVEDILTRDPETRFVCLQREREATCRSWEKAAFGKRRFGVRFAWRAPDGKIHVDDAVGGSEGPIPEAIRAYYDAYYTRSRDLAAKYPRRFRIFRSPDVIEGRKARREMLRFAGLKRPVVSRPRVHTKGTWEKARMKNIVDDLAMDQLEHGGRKIVIPHDVLEAHGIDQLDPSTLMKVAIG